MTRVEDLEKQLEVRKCEQYIPDFPEFKLSSEPSWYMNVILQSVGPFQDSGSQYDYNIFHTKEYAQEFAKKCKLIAMMLHCKWYLDRDYVPNWKNKEESKYFVCYDNVNGCFKYGLDHSFNGCSISFGTDAAARKCAEWLNEHWKESGDEYNS